MTDGWVTLPGVLTAAEVAEHLQTTVQTVNRERREGRLAGFRVGRPYRYTADDVAAYIQRKKEDPQ